METPRNTNASGPGQLQELYAHLDSTGIDGDVRMSYYGQLRASEHTHAEALEMTIEHFSLRLQPWYKARQEGGRLP